ncbi:MAG: hypothetical protein ACFFDI_06190 [Promethearchaeota archaeon]
MSLSTLLGLLVTIFAFESLQKGENRFWRYYALSIICFTILSFLISFGSSLSFWNVIPGFLLVIAVPWPLMFLNRPLNVVEEWIHLEDGESIIAVSDVHLGFLYSTPNQTYQSEKELFQEFLTQLADRTLFPNCKYLVLVGDIFELWERDTAGVLLENYDIFRTLRSIKETGIEIHYLVGNHDYYFSEFKKEISIVAKQTHEIPLERPAHLPILKDCVLSSDGRYVGILHMNEANTRYNLEISSVNPPRLATHIRVGRLSSPSNIPAIPTCFAISSHYAVVGYSSGELIVQRLQGVRNRISYSRHIGDINFCVISPNENYLVVGSSEDYLIIQRMAGSIICCYKLNVQITAITISPQATFIAVGCHTGECLIFNDEGDLRKTIREERVNPVKDCVFCPREDCLAIIYNDFIKIYEMYEGKILEIRINKEHFDTCNWAYGERWFFTSSHSTFGTGNKVTLWDIGHHRAQKMGESLINEPLKSSVRTPDGEIISISLTATNKAYIRKWSPVRYNYPSYIGRLEAISGLCFHRSGLMFKESERMRNHRFLDAEFNEYWFFHGDECDPLQPVAFYTPITKLGDDSIGVNINEFWQSIANLKRRVWGLLAKLLRLQPRFRIDIIRNTGAPAYLQLSAHDPVLGQKAVNLVRKHRRHRRLEEYGSCFIVMGHYHTPLRDFITFQNKGYFLGNPGAWINPALEGEISTNTVLEIRANGSDRDMTIWKIDWGSSPLRKTPLEEATVPSRRKTRRVIIFSTSHILKLFKKFYAFLEKDTVVVKKYQEIIGNFKYLFSLKARLQYKFTVLQAFELLTVFYQIAMDLKKPSRKIEIERKSTGEIDRDKKVYEGKSVEIEKVEMEVEVRREENEVVKGNEEKENDKDLLQKYILILLEDKAEELDTPDRLRFTILTAKEVCVFMCDYLNTEYPWGYYWEFIKADE